MSQQDPFPRERIAATLRRIPAYLKLAWRLARDPLLSRARRAAVVAAAGYLASPIDLVPGVIPVLGQLDDIAVAIAALRFAMAGLDADRRREHLASVGLEDSHLADDLRTLASTSAWMVRAGARTTTSVAKAGGRITVTTVRAAGRGVSAASAATSKAAPAVKGATSKARPVVEGAAAKAGPVIQGAAAKAAPVVQGASSAAAKAAPAVKAAGAKAAPAVRGVSSAAAKAAPAAREATSRTAEALRGAVGRRSPARMTIRVVRPPALGAGPADEGLPVEPDVIELPGPAPDRAP